MKLLRKSFFATARNSLSIASRKAISAEAALTASIPLIASICCEVYFPWLCSMSKKRGLSTLTEKTISAA